MRNRSACLPLCLLVVLLVVLGATLALVPAARADGGAPNLAYVSGAPGGVAIIDIASQKITGTVQVAGDPRGMTLSLDGRSLYVALAAKNGVAVIDAQAKQVVNTLSTGPAPTRGKLPAGILEGRAVGARFCYASHPIFPGAQPSFAAQSVTTAGRCRC